MYPEEPNVSFDMGSLATGKGPNPEKGLQIPFNEVHHDMLRMKSAVNSVIRRMDWTCAGAGESSGSKLVI